jgi:hypothetical protein
VGGRSRHQPEASDQRSRYYDHARVLHHGHQARISPKGHSWPPYPRLSPAAPQSGGLLVETGAPCKEESNRRAQEQSATHQEGYREPVSGHKGATT